MWAHTCTPQQMWQSGGEGWSWNLLWPLHIHGCHTCVHINYTVTHMWKIPMTFFTEVEEKKTTVEKFMWKHRRILRQFQEEKASLLVSTPDLKFYYRAIMFKNWVVLTQKQAHWPLEQKRGLEINPHSYSHLKFYQGVKNRHRRKMASSNDGAGKTECSYVQGWENSPSSYTKTNSKWIKTLL